MLALRQGYVEGIRLGRSLAPPATAPAGLSTAQSVFGSTSLFNNGALPNRIIATPTTGFAFGTGNFTIELWFRPTATNQCLLVDFRPLGSTGRYPIVWWDTSQIKYNVSQVNVIVSSTLALNTWYSIALVRQSTTSTLYINGNSVGTWADTTSYLVGSVAIGCNAYAATGTPAMYGFIDELRISNVARYSANYSVATEPFVDDIDTLLLCHFDGSAGSINLVDDNS